MYNHHYQLKWLDIHVSLVSVKSGYTYHWFLAKKWLYITDFAKSGYINLCFQPEVVNT